MQPIAYFNIPAYGHIGPTLPIVEQLVDRGARVLYFVDEAYREPVEAAGAEVRPVPNYIRMPTGVTPKSMIQFATLLVEQAAASIPALQGQLEAEGVGMILHDHVCPWGRFLAKLTGLPSVRTCSILLAPDPVMPRMKMTPAVIAKQLPHLPELIRYRRAAGRLRRDFGLEDLRIGDVLRNRADLTLLFTSREYLPHSDRLDERYRFVGASISDRPPAPLPFAPQTGRPLIYISMGTVYNESVAFYQTCKEAFGSADVFVVLSVGSKVDPAALAPWPENFFVARSVPQVAVLSGASLFITQAGGCSVNESLVKGVPMVVCPQTFEHAFNADCVVAHGAGVRFRTRGATAVGLRAAAATVLEDGRYRSRARTLGDTLIRAGGAARAAELILAFQASPGVLPR